MILALQQDPPSIFDVLSIWPIALIVVLSLLLVGAYYLGRRHRGINRPESWSRVEVLTALGVAVMVATLFVTLLNAEVRNWLGLP